MRSIEKDIKVITGAPLIGEGNIIDVRSIEISLNRVGVSTRAFFPDGPIIWLGRFYHTFMSMNTRKTMEYAFHSEARRSSLKARPLILSLRHAMRAARRRFPDAGCMITPQNIIAEAAVMSGEFPSIVMSSDQSGKFMPESSPSPIQKKIRYLVWNREAQDLLTNGLGLEHVQLVVPPDPRDAFIHIGRKHHPFREFFDEPRLCCIRLSGSGGDPKLINTAISSLWKKSRVRSIVFPGNIRTATRLIKRTEDRKDVHYSLDSAVYYNFARRMISGEQMLLVYPSEQLRHIIHLAQEKISPGVVWLPPRGEHEMNNLAWAIKKGFSSTICVPEEYQRDIGKRLSTLGTGGGAPEFVSPESLSREHFKPSPLWNYERGAVPYERIVKKYYVGA